LKEADPIEKAEKDFWKIVDDEKRKRDKKAAAAAAAEEKLAAESGATAQAENAADTTAQKVE